MSDNLKNIKFESIWLVGCGGMAADYTKVLKGLNTPFTCIGRGLVSAEAFEQKTGVAAVTGGIDKALEGFVPEYAIIAAGVPELAQTALSAVNAGVKHVLLEKPGGMDAGELAEISKAARKHGADVRIAYNRRFYSSVLAAEKIIRDDGGVLSFNFEFTEWLHVFRAMSYFNRAVNIFFTNSTHVIDMAFFLGGFPAEFRCFSIDEGCVVDPDSRHIYAGAGVSKAGALFSYSTNWDAPGRWGVEVLTRKSRLIFRPLELLSVQKPASVAIEKVDIDNTLDLEYKPGLYRETKAFLTGEDLDRLPTVHGQLEHCGIYNKMQKGLN